MPARLPKGYRGEKHETIGSDILSVLGTLKLPEQILGADTVKQLEAIKPDGWYPIGILLDVMERMDARVGTFGMMQMGRTLFKMSHEEHVKKVIKSASELLMGFDGIYHRANRGKDIGGWKVLSFAPGKCEMEKNTPHHCVMEEGILLQALEAIGVMANVRQQQCFRKGADNCRYVITSAITDKRWTG